MRRFENKTFNGIIKERVRLEGLQFENCLFSGCKFIDCVFSDCEFTECVFTDCAFVNPETKGSGMSFSTFRKSSLVGIRWAEFCRGSVSFPLQSLEKCFMKYCDFDRMRLLKFDFSGNEIVDCAFRSCVLTEARFIGCGLAKTEFRECDLKKCDFRRASGYFISLSENNVKGAKFSYPEAVRLLLPFGIEIDD